MEYKRKYELTKDQVDYLFEYDQDLKNLLHVYIDLLLTDLEEENVEKVFKEMDKIIDNFVDFFFIKGKETTSEELIEMSLDYEKKLEELKKPEEIEKNNTSDVLDVFFRGNEVKANVNIDISKNLSNYAKTELRLREIKK